MAIKIDLGTKSSSAVRNVKIDATAELTGSEVLTGTPTITESTLTLTGKAINSSATVEINGATVALNKAILFTVAGGTAGTTYSIAISVGTTSNPAETLTYDGQLEVV